MHSVPNQVHTSDPYRVTCTSVTVTHSAEGPVVKEARAPFMDTSTPSTSRSSSIAIT